MTDALGTRNDAERLTDPVSSYAEAVGDAHYAAHKQCRAAYLSYLDAIRKAVSQPAVLEAARLYSDGVKANLTTQDTESALDIGRKYAAAAREAQDSLREHFQDAHHRLTEEVQRASATVTDARKRELEGFVKSLQVSFAGADAADVDAATLAQIGQAALTAAWLRAYLT